MKKNNMLFKTVLFFIMLQVPFIASAQNEIMRHIEVIKHDNNFLSSKKTTNSKSESEAVNEALKKINYVVKKYIRDSTDLAIDISQVGLEEKGERLVYNEEGIYYVFIYIPKSLILELGGNTTPSLETTTISSPETVEENQPEVISHTTQPQSVSDASQSVQLDDSIELATDLAEWQRTVIVELLACVNLNDVISKLQQLKDNFKVKRWGAAKDCRDADKSYWIIFDEEQRLVTILGTGADKKMNYSTFQYSSLNDYKNMSAIWFYMAK